MPLPSNGWRAGREPSDYYFSSQILRILAILKPISQSTTVSDYSAGVDDSMFPAKRQFTANDLLLIGPEAMLDGLIAGFRDRRSVQPRAYTSYAMPSESILALIDLVFVYEVEEHQRFQQLKYCCEYQRRHGGIEIVFGFSCNLDPRLAKLVRAAGAEFAPLGKAGLGHSLREEVFRHAA
jgi:hypothetical protein